MKAAPPHHTFGVSLLARATADFVRGLCVLRHADPYVTVFGSARMNRNAAIHRTAIALGSALSRAGFTVMTGGGPGLMEAVCRGARDAGGRAVGCCISLAVEQARNRHLDRRVTFRYFFVRKVMLCRRARAFVALPGGLGTLDELFEILTLIQTERIARLPVVLLGTEYWSPLLTVLRGMAAAGTLDRSDLDHMYLTDDVAAAVGHIVTGTASRTVPAGRVSPWADPSIAT
ncbi:MAG: TIGR00730 family Rossman fold protein [Vicinamibacterales bacterium]